MKNTKISTMAILAVFSQPLFADGHSAGLMGSHVVVTNTFQGDLTSNVETDVSSFGLENNQFSTVGNEVEFPNFITLYSVDISSNSIAFSWGDSDFAKQLSGPTTEGNHDRNYFVFDLPASKNITAVSLDKEASSLIDGSAEPTATVLGPNRIVTDFSTGVIRGQGFNPVFTVTVEEKK